MPSHKRTSFAPRLPYWMRSDVADPGKWQSKPLLEARPAPDVRHDLSHRQGAREIVPSECDQGRWVRWTRVLNGQRIRSMMTVLWHFPVATSQQLGAFANVDRRDLSKYLQPLDAYGLVKRHHPSRPRNGGSHPYLYALNVGSEPLAVWQQQMRDFHGHAFLELTGASPPADPTDDAQCATLALEAALRILETIGTIELLGGPVHATLPTGSSPRAHVILQRADGLRLLLDVVRERHYERRRDAWADALAHQRPQTCGSAVLLLRVPDIRTGASNFRPPTRIVAHQSPSRDDHGTSTPPSLHAAAWDAWFPGHDVSTDGRALSVRCPWTDRPQGELAHVDGAARHIGMIFEPLRPVWRSGIGA